MTDVRSQPPTAEIKRSILGVPRLVAWIGLAVAAVALLTVAAVDGGGVETDAERIQRLNESFACPTCQGESVAESNAAVSVTIRQFIADRVTEGATDTEIRNDLIRAYRAEVLLNPPAEGFATLLWILPVLAVVVGAVGVTAAVSRRSTGVRQADDRDRELVDRARRRLGADRTAPSGTGNSEKAGNSDD